MGASRPACHRGCQRRRHPGRDGDHSRVRPESRAQGGRDGLYWETAPGEPLSPLGPLVARATAEGYKNAEQMSPYHGYYFRILKGQGENAGGGAYSYIVNGNMIGGFAVVAWPALYRSSGVKTFMVNHEGVVYEKDLGADTAKLATAMAGFDPDASWKVRQGRKQPGRHGACERPAPSRGRVGPPPSSCLRERRPVGPKGLLEEIREA